MAISVEVIIFYLVLIDSIGSNLVVWFGEKWYTKNFKIFSRYFPIAKGWSALYLILVLWIGSIFYRSGILFF
ncbi:MAG: hypothetical protein CMH62_01475 [Nanoarchaeota archaeon]|nr:hypothetical protein [Nanoarchaeota archaeon]|tara:strand:- start:1352 stop:1567 length:216 start_codon:yes stop_codon:yes gene_type:complete